MTKPIPKENERFLIPYFLDKKNIEMSRIPWPTTEIDWIYSCPHTHKSLLETFFAKKKEENKYFDFEVDKEFRSLVCDKTSVIFTSILLIKMLLRCVTFACQFLKTFFILERLTLFFSWYLISNILSNTF